MCPTNDHTTPGCANTDDDESSVMTPHADSPPTKGEDVSLHLSLDDLPAYAFVKTFGTWRYTYMNASLLSLGRSYNDNCIGATDEDIWPASMARAMRLHDEDVLREGKSFTYIETLPLQGREVRYRFSKFPILKQGKPVAIGGMVIDASDMNLTHSNVPNESIHDLLTGLPNRHYLLDRLNKAIARMRKDATQTFALIYLDLDGFMLINDGLGHDVGDMLLAAVAERFLDMVRGADLLAHMGGDQFVVLLQGHGAHEGAILGAERFLKRIQEPFHILEHILVLTVSIGVVFSEAQEEDAEAVLHKADTAKHRAKSAGKGQYQVFQEQMQAQATHHLRTATDLRRAIKNNEFVLHYQPIVNLETATVAGFEALIRWNHPERGLVGPGEFIPVAEETGLIMPIGNWILKESFRTILNIQNSFRDKEPPFLSVNLSVIQLRRENLTGLIENAVAKSNLNPRCLKLEITETLLMENAFKVIPTLEHLRALGVRLAIDDFGTGYSSLSYLSYLPVDTLKIDKAFIDDLERGSGPETRLVQGILNLAESLDMTAIAEGVETKGQCGVLQKLGCPLIQGYYFSKPVPLQQAMDLIKENDWEGAVFNPSHD